MPVYAIASVPIKSDCCSLSTITSPDINTVEWNVDIMLQQLLDKHRPLQSGLDLSEYFTNNYLLHFLCPLLRTLLLSRWDCVTAPLGFPDTSHFRERKSCSAADCNLRLTALRVGLNSPTTNAEHEEHFVSYNFVVITFLLWFVLSRLHCSLNRGNHSFLDRVVDYSRRFW